MATQIAEPNEPAPANAQAAATPRPLTLRDVATLRYHDITLQEATRLALVNSKVLIDLGGQVIRAPSNLATSYDVATQESDPQFGVEAALAAFDATLALSGDFQHNDQHVNNLTVGDNGDFRQSYDVLQEQIDKRTATGSEFTIRQIMDYNRDTNVGDLFPGGAWDEILEVSAAASLAARQRHRVQPHRRPGASPAFTTACSVAQLRTDVSLADFELGLRDYVTNVENAYWDLYFAYRDLDIKIKARDVALDTWRNIKALNAAGKQGGEADKEAQAREQYYPFPGRRAERTGGPSRRGDAHQQRRPRGRVPRLAGRASGRTPPPHGHGRADLRRRVAPPLRRAVAGPDPLRLVRRQLRCPGPPCRAAPPTVYHQEPRAGTDRRRATSCCRASISCGTYRWRGFGKDLINSDRNGIQEFDNAFADMTGGKYQEWELGAQFSMPLGFRQGHSAVRNAELLLSRDRAVECQMERQIIHDVSNAVAEVDRAYQVVQTDVDFAASAKRELDLLTNIVFQQNKPERLFEMLDAQRRYADALDHYYQAAVEYALAIRNVHFAKGTLLDYCDVSLAEGPWPEKAYRDAQRREQLRSAPHSIDYVFRQPPVVSRGPLSSCTGQVGIPGELPSATTNQHPAKDGPSKEGLPPPPAPAEKNTSAPAAAVPGEAVTRMGATRGTLLADPFVQPCNYNDVEESAGPLHKVPSAVAEPFSRFLDRYGDANSAEGIFGVKLWTVDGR